MRFEFFQRALRRKKNNNEFELKRKGKQNKGDAKPNHSATAKGKELIGKCFMIFSDTQL